MKASVTIPVNDANEWSMVSQFMDVLESYRASSAQQQSAAIEAELTKESVLAQDINAAPVAAAEPVPPVTVQTTHTVAAAIEVFKAYAQANGLAKARSVLDALGVKRAGDITEAQIPALLEAIK